MMRFLLPKLLQIQIKAVSLQYRITNETGCQPSEAAQK
nr:MAG TPA: hypothetical protein [Caudoviricetes sp.]